MGRTNLLSTDLVVPQDGEIAEYVLPRESAELRLLQRAVASQLLPAGTAADRHACAAPSLPVRLDQRLSASRFIYVESTVEMPLAAQLCEKAARAMRARPVDILQPLRITSDAGDTALVLEPSIAAAAARPAKAEAAAVPICGYRLVEPRASIGCGNAGRRSAHAALKPAVPMSAALIRYQPPTQQEWLTIVEYDADENDLSWLRSQAVPPAQFLLPVDEFERVIDRLEKASFEFVCAELLRPVHRYLSQLNSATEDGFTNAPKEAVVAVHGDSSTVPDHRANAANRTAPANGTSPRTKPANGPISALADGTSPRTCPPVASGTAAKAEPKAKPPAGVTAGRRIEIDEISDTCTLHFTGKETRRPNSMHMLGRAAQMDGKTVKVRCAAKPAVFTTSRSRFYVARCAAAPAPP